MMTQNSITKLDQNAKIVDLDVPSNERKQLKDPVLSVVRSWVQECVSPDPRALEM